MSLCLLYCRYSLSVRVGMSAVVIRQTPHHVQLINNNATQRGEAPLLRHPVDQTVGLLNSADHNPSVGLQYTGAALAAVVPLHLPGLKRIVCCWVVRLRQGHSVLLN